MAQKRSETDGTFEGKRQRKRDSSTSENAKPDKKRLSGLSPFAMQKRDSSASQSSNRLVPRTSGASLTPSQSGRHSATSSRHSGRTSIDLEKLAAVSQLVDRSVLEDMIDDAQADGYGMTVQDAMATLIGYLRLDPDGGIMNLDDENYEFADADQVTKLHVLLKKDLLRIMLAIICCVRIFVNVPTLIFQSFHRIFCYFTPDCPAIFSEELARDCVLPLKELAVLVAVFEMTTGIIVVGRALLHTAKFKLTAEQVRKRRMSVVDDITQTVGARYFFLARLTFEDLLNLQTYSAMRCFAFVHPALLGHYMKDLILRDDAARALFERMLGITECSLPDDQLHGLISNIILNAQSFESEQVKKVKALHYSEMSAYRLFRALRDEVGGLPASDLIIEPIALQKHSWKVLVIAYAETAFFVSGRMALAVFGTMAFIVKLSAVAVVLFNRETKGFTMVITILTFLNQTLGIMSVQHLLQWRIFRFVFGGQDAHVSLEEVVLCKIYQALIAEKIWMSKATGASYLTKCITLLTISDDDLQRLIVEESASSKAAITSSVRKAVATRDIASASFLVWLLGRSHQWIRGEVPPSPPQTQPMEKLDTSNCIRICPEAPDEAPAKICWDTSGTQVVNVEAGTDEDVMSVVPVLPVDLYSTELSLE